MPEAAAGLLCLSLEYHDYRGKIKPVSEMLDTVMDFTKINDFHWINSLHIWFKLFWLIIFSLNK